MATRVSHSTAHMYLHMAEREGWIYSFRRKKMPNGRTYYLIEVPSTHYANYHDPSLRGVIALTAREVLAFIEGCWAARGIHPTNRAGAESGSASRDFAEEQRQQQQRESTRRLSNADVQDRS